MDALSHYQQLLAPVYTWMSGDFESQVDHFHSMLSSHNLLPQDVGAALDLGAGHGIQSVAMARAGYRVIAIDFSEHLLTELKRQASALPIQTQLADIRNFRNYPALPCELIVCAGDTLTHLDSTNEVEQLIVDIAATLVPGGSTLLSFRNYCSMLPESQRTIPVKEDPSRKMTCTLAYEGAKVKVTDTVEENLDGRWKTQQSTYTKLRLDPESVKHMLMACGMQVKMLGPQRGMHTLIGTLT